MPQRLEQIVNCDNKPLTNTSKSLTRLRRFKKRSSLKWYVIIFIMVYVVTQIIKHSGFNLKFSHYLQQLFITQKQTINKQATGKNNSIQGCGELFTKTLH